MAEQQRAARGPPDTASAAEVRATQKVAAAQEALNRSFSGTLLKVAAAGGAAYLAYYMWKRSEEPLPQPAGKAVSKMIEAVNTGAEQQKAELATNAVAPAAPRTGSSG